MILISILVFLTTVAQIILIGAGTKYAGIAIPACLSVAFGIQVFYLRTSRQLRLLELEAKAPLYAHFTETLEGLLTIRAFGWQSQLLERHDVLADVSQQPFYLLHYIQIWLAFVLNCMVAGLAILLVALAVTLRNSTSAPIFAAAMINVLGFSQNICGLLDAWTSLESSLGAIARVKGTVEDLQSLEGAKKATPHFVGTLPTEGRLQIEKATATYE